MKVLATLLLFSTILISCQDNDPEAESSEYIVIRNINEAGIRKGIISEFNSATMTYVEDVVELTPSPPTITDACYQEGNLFFTSTLLHPSLFISSLYKIDIENKVQTHSVPLWLNGFKTIPYQDKLIACGFNFDERIMTFLFYDQNLILTDSIVQEDYIRNIYDVAIAENKLFCSVRKDDGDRLVYVLDISTKNVIKTFPFEDNCWQFVEIDNQLVAMEDDKFHYINTSTLSVTTEIDRLPIGDDPLFYNSSDGLIYWLAPAAQPSLRPYFLLTYNLKENKSEFVTKVPITITDPIVYDEKLNVIVSGGPRVYSLKGELLFEAESPAVTPFIFVK
ncbi:MAG: hypothetical protein AB7O48_05955 [Cyclobacteriaceae bacterium]